MLSCEVFLDESRSLYFPGNSVVGRVVCRFSKAEFIEGVTVNLTGSEYATWTEWEGDGHSRKKRRGRPVHYRGSHSFLSLSKALAGAGDVGPNCQEFPFTIELPTHLPSTYNAKYGWVKYVVKATVTKPNQDDYQDEKEVRIVSFVDFNEMKNRLPLKPVSHSQEKNFCCWCCASGSIVIDVHLEKAAFVVGETVKVNVEITNGSKENIDMLVAEIGTGVISRVQLPTPRSKEDYELLAIARNSGVEPRSSKSYCVELQIPPTSGIPNFERLTLFSQRSTLKVTAVLSIFHLNLVLSMDIVVGNVPIGDDPAQYRERILQLASFGVPRQPPPDLINANSTNSASEEHVILPARIPLPFSSPNVDLHTPPHTPSTPQVRLQGDVYAPPLEGPLFSDVGPGRTNITSDKSGPPVSWESPPPSYEDATRPD